MQRPSSTLPLLDGSRSQSAMDSLQSNLSDDDFQLSLNRSQSTNKTWRRSVGGLAHNMLLKAKASVDTMRGAVDRDELAEDEEMGLIRRDTADTINDSLQLNHRRLGSSRLQRGATSSLRRAFDSTSKLSKRSSFFGSGTSKHSYTDAPRGPEEFAEDEPASPVGSEKRLSFSSVRGLIMPTKSPSKHGSPLSKSESKAERHSLDSSLEERSSPIPIRRDSPPPTIRMDIEAGRPLTTTFFESMGEAPILFSENLTARPERTPPLMAKLSMLVEDVQPFTEHIPRRASNDHWKMRKVSRRSSTMVPLPFPDEHVQEFSTTPKHPALDDPFETNNFQASKVKSQHSNSVDAETTMHSSMVDIETGTPNDPVPCRNTKLSANRQASKDESDIGPGGFPGRAPASQYVSSDGTYDQPLEGLRRPANGQIDRVTGEGVNHNSSVPAEHIVPPEQPSLQFVSTLSQAKFSVRHFHDVPGPCTALQKRARADPFVLPSKSSLNVNDDDSASVKESDDDAQSVLITQDLFYSSEGSGDEEDGSNLVVSNMKMRDVAAKDRTAVALHADQNESLVPVAAIAPRDRDHRGKHDTIGGVATRTPQREDSYDADSEPASPVIGWLADLQKLRANRERQYKDLYKNDEDKENIEQCSEDGRCHVCGELGKHFCQPITTGSPPHSPNEKADSACFIPVCEVCGGPDDHYCRPNLRLDDTSFPPLHRVSHRSPPAITNLVELTEESHAGPATLGISDLLHRPLTYAHAALKPLRATQTGGDIVNRWNVWSPSTASPPKHQPRTPSAHGKVVRSPKSTPTRKQRKQMARVLSSQGRSSEDNVLSASANNLRSNFTSNEDRENAGSETDRWESLKSSLWSFL